MQAVHMQKKISHWIPMCRLRMPLFLVCLLCFLVAISILSPAEATSAIHKHLESHFGLGDVGDIKDVAGIYDFVTAFEKKNLEMMPASPNYWCEHRYYKYAWDDHYQIPVSSCSSPRYTALGLQSAPVWTNATVTTSGSHRRLGVTHGGESTATKDESVQMGFFSSFLGFFDFAETTCHTTCQRQA